MVYRIFLPLVAALVLSFSSISCADTPNGTGNQAASKAAQSAEAHSPEASTPGADSDLGGWNELTVESEEIRSVFSWAQARIAEEHPGILLKPPEQAERQVVAGYKYRLHCPYLHTEESKPRGKAVIVVWKKPDDTLELLSTDFSED